jgi:ComF family protein
MPRGRNTYRLAAALLNVLYPSACPVCSGPSDSLSHCPICSICWAAIRRHDGPSCRVCARPLASEHAGLCGDCLREPPPFSRVITYGPYSDVLKEALHLLKFSSVKRLSRPLGLLLAGLEMPEVDFIVPVPLSGRELRRRGFNQTLLISRTLSRTTGIPLCQRLLHKKRETPPQVSLPRRERLLNLRGAFEAREKLNGERVLIVDDVVTTGATVRECSRAIIKAGAAEVFVAALARSG